MDEKLSAQALGKRHIVESLDRAFARLHLRSCRIIEQTAAADLYEAPAGPSMASAFCAVLPSSSKPSAALRQTFGTIRLSGLCRNI